MGRDSIELFSDYFAQAANGFTRIDARIKLAFVIAVLMLVLLVRRIDMLLLVAVVSTGSLLAVNIPLKTVATRLAGPLAMAAVILLLQGLFYGKTVLYSIGYGEIGVALYREGIDSGLLVAGRVVAGTSLMLFLSMTTPINKLLGALKFFRVPGGWLEIMVFTYRYIFVFIEEAQSIMDAQRLRLGYKGIRTGLKSWGDLIGSLFTRVYDQANATHEAMTLRGYNGTMHTECPGPLSAYDASAGLVMAAVFLLLLVATVHWG